MRRILGLVVIVSVVALTSIGVWSPAGAAIDSATIVATPSPGGAGTDNRLNGVSCASASSCMAVGRFSNGVSSTQPLATVWNGSAWSPVTPTNPGVASASNFLSGVSCVSASFCVAVGRYDSGAGGQALSLLWNGSTWTPMSTPVPVTPMGDELAGVSCVSSGFCVAVGWRWSNAGVQQTLTLVWDGSQWSVVSSPNPGGTSTENILYGVSCLSPNWCTAVGRYGGSSAGQTVAMQWDGTSWTSMTTPNPGAAAHDELSSVACTSTTMCVATGYFNNGTADQNLALLWNGSSWTQMTTPNAAGASARNRLNSVTCDGPSSCVMVGRAVTTTTSQTSVLIWDGATSTILPSPNSATNVYNTLASVSCVSVAFCMTAGHHTAGTGTETLSILLTGPPPPTTTTTTATTVPTPVVPADDPVVPSFAG